MSRSLLLGIAFFGMVISLILVITRYDFSRTDFPKITESQATDQPKPSTSSLPSGTTALNPLESYYARFQMGDFEGAVKILRLMNQKDPIAANIKRDLATALFALGMFRLTQNNRAEAESLLEESASHGHFDSEQVLASLRLKAGKLDAAAQTFEDMYLKTQDKGILKLLVDMALAKDDLSRSDGFLNRFEEKFLNENADSTDKEFLENRRSRLELKRRFARTEEVVERNGVQVAFSRPDLRAAAESVLTAIETVVGELTKILGPLPADFPMRALLIPKSDFRGDSGAPPWAGALFDGFVRIPVAVDQLSNFQIQKLGRLARHETAHAYFYAHCGETLPSWLGEGLAQHYEGVSVQQSLHGLLGSEGRSAAAEPPASFDNSFIDAPTSEVHKLYLRSHLLVEALSKNEGFESTWREIFTTSCTQTTPLSPVLREKFGTSNGRELYLKYWDQIKLFIR